jgi:rhodanese-related sulfurtransferase
VLCQEGYTSSLAAAALHELGVWRATDVVGGYAAWRDSGVPLWVGPSTFARTPDGLEILG